MQIHLTYRNTLRNVKRRVLHTLGLAMYYITRRVLVAGIPPHQQAKASPLHAVKIKILNMNIKSDLKIKLYQ